MGNFEGWSGAAQLPRVIAGSVVPEGRPRGNEGGPESGSHARHTRLAIMRQWVSDHFGRGQRGSASSVVSSRSNAYRSAEVRIGSAA